MLTVAIHPPKTPVTSGSRGIAKATLPNVCKMPGPPAPFVPSPLPNIAKSGTSPKDYSTTVKFDGATIAIRGAMFESMGDMASKGTGGGLISANTHGPARFITPGSMTVKVEGKSVHLLGEPMLNNCGPSGSPPNTGATMMGVHQYDRNASAEERALQDIMCDCHQNTPKTGNCKIDGIRAHDCCEDAIAAHKPPPDLGGERGYDVDGNFLTTSRKALSAAKKIKKGMCFPDACAMSGGQPTQFFDFKFPCSKEGKAASDFYGDGPESQYERYTRLSQQLGITAQPRVITSQACR
ncbi:PAAR-like domain-containing protein [Pseudoduganella sp. HUAS MS19]